MSVVIRHADADRSGDVCVVGPLTKALHKRMLSGRATIIDFEIGWSVPLLGVPAPALTDQILPLEALWGRRGAALSSEVLSIDESDRVASILIGAMVEHAVASPVSSSVQIARRASRLLEAPGAKVEQVAKALGLTDRHLRRAFRDGIGISPKHFARTARLSRAVRIAETEPDWSRVASAAGYADQAHLITEFRRLTGFTPTKFRAATT